jgi:ankyrin repeat protein
MMMDDTTSYDLKASLDFFNAVKSKDLKKAKSIYSKGNVDPNKTNVETGLTPLLQAIRNKDGRMVDFLLTIQDIDIDKCDDKKYCLPPISHAIQMKYSEMIDLLIVSGCDVDKGSDGKNGGNTPLMIACWHGQTETVSKLLDVGACVNQQDTNGFTALIKCCIQKHPETASLLIDSTDLKIRCRKGKTAEDYARESKDPELQKLFAGKRFA